MSDRTEAEQQSETPEEVTEAARVAHTTLRHMLKQIEQSQPPTWDKLPEWQQESQEHMAMAVWRDLSCTARQCHSFWRHTLTSAGWEYGENLDPVEKIHPDIVPWEELEPLQRACFDVVVGACRASMGF